jgi:uncharacterized protein YabN with tetrapyrrole methylase and pyrophosphatase domain
VGLNRGDVAIALMKVEEDSAELKAALAEGDEGNTAKRYGDLLFSMANLGRLAGVHPETALTATISGFVTDFKRLEKGLKEQGRTLESASPEEIHRLWEGYRTDR